LTNVPKFAVQPFDYIFSGGSLMAVYTKIKEDFWSIIQEMQTHIPDLL